MLDPITNQSMFEACVKRVARVSVVAECTIRRVVHSGLLEGVPAHHTLRGIYRRAKRRQHA